MNKKQYFEAPQAELIVVRFEENFCQTTPRPSKPGAAGADDEYNDMGDF